MTSMTVAIDNESRELAYRIWCGPGGQSPAKVSRILAAEPYCRDVRSNTIAQWAIRDDWPARRAKDIGGALGGMEQETAANLVAAGNLASREILAAVIEYQETGKAPPKEATTLLMAAVNYAGFSPVGSDKTAGKMGGTERRGILVHLNE